MSDVLQKAVRKWQAGDHYEAHETLEDFAEEVEDNDDDWKRALALCHVAAALHKYINNVSPAAVPAKLQKALIELDSAPKDWFGLDLESFRHEISTMLNALQKNQFPATKPSLRFRR
jgi:hypothetical protein